MSNPGSNKKAKLERALNAMDRFIASKIEDSQDHSEDYMGDYEAKTELREAFDALLGDES